jgi:hypothetical protein
MVVLEREAKKKYKTKKKEKFAVVENLITWGQTMIGEQLCDEKVKNI